MAYGHFFLGSRNLMVTAPGLSCHKLCKKLMRCERHMLIFVL